MSEVEAEIAVAGAIIVAIIGSVVAYVLQERSATRALRQEIALRPYLDRVTALKAVYLDMVNCFWALARNFGGTTEEKFSQSVVDPLERFEITIARNQLWLSAAQPKILAALGKFRLTVVALRFRMQEPGMSEQRPPPPGFLDVKWEDLENPYKEAVIAIGQALGVEVLEKSLNELIPSVLNESTKTDSK